MLGVSLELLYDVPALSELFGNSYGDLVLKVIPIVLIGRLKHPKPSHLNVQIHFFFYPRVSGTKRFDLGVLQNRLVHVPAAAQRILARHYLCNEFLFVFDCLIQVCIERTLSDVPVDIDLFIAVSLTDYASRALFKIRGPPRTV